MVTRNFNLEFSFTDETYAKYVAWCKENHLDGYHGAIGGSTSFVITPTSIGTFIDAVGTKVIMDENGEPSYDENGKIKTKEVRLTLEEP